MPASRPIIANNHHFFNSDCKKLKNEPVLLLFSGKPVIVDIKYISPVSYKNTGSLLYRHINFPKYKSLLSLLYLYGF